jgi:hypothetical protein
MDTQTLVSESSTGAAGGTVKLGKFAASKMILTESWAILKQDKEVMWFPVLSALVASFAVLVLIIGYYIVVLGNNIDALSENGSEQGPVVMYATLLVFYLVTFFITNYFQAGMLTIIAARLKGQNLGFKDGIRGANKSLGKLFVWSLISATVGVILKVIEDRGKVFGTIVSLVLGAAWNILTFFSLPALIVGETSITDSFKESAAIIRKTWGEAIIVNFGVGLMLGLFVAVVLIVAAVLCFVFPTPVAIAIILGLGLITIVAASVVSSTLGVIFKLALYEFAKTGTIPTGFSAALVQGAIQKK